MRKVTVSRIRERYAQTVLTFRITYVSHSYTFRHYLVILRELEISTLPSYTSISDPAVGSTIYN